MTRVDDIETAARQRLYAEQTRLEKELADAEARAGELEARRASGVASSEEELAAISRISREGRGRAPAAARRGA
jgi:hypothetical protein